MTISFSWYHSNRRPQNQLNFSLYFLLNSISFEKQYNKLKIVYYQRTKHLKMDEKKTRLAPRFLPHFSVCYIRYNIAFVNSEHWLAKSRVDITLCQHGKFPATLLLKFFVLYYKRNIKHFPRWYTVISTLVKIGKTRNCVKTLCPAGVVFPHNFSFFQFSRVLI